MTPEELLAGLLQKLNDSDLEYAVVNPGKGNFPDTSSDVDLVFSANPEKILDETLKSHSSREGIRVVQKLHYEVPCGYYYIIFLPGNGKSSYLHLDCLYDPYGLNRYHLPTTYLLQDREKADWGFRCSPLREAEYLFVKRIVKNAWTKERYEQTKSLFDKNKIKLDDITRKWLGQHGANRFSRFISHDSHAPGNGESRQLRKSLESRYAIRHPVKWFSRKLYTGIRLFFRLLSPCGCFIVLIGPDGAGKSTINHYIQAELKRGFRSIWHFHWRPKLLPKLGRQATRSSQPVTDGPPEESRYTGIVSLARFIYYWLDFILGYWLRIYPRRAASTLVIGERYFPDVLVHPERYGFSVPRWLLRLAAKLVPSADLLILLKDTPEAIYARKPELPIEKIRHQLSAYEAELGHWRSPQIIMTSDGPDAAGIEVARLVINDCHKRIYPAIIGQGE